MCGSAPRPQTTRPVFTSDSYDLQQNIDLSFCLVDTKGLARLAALGLVSMSLCCMIVKIVEPVALIDMRKTDSFGDETCPACTQLIMSWKA